MLRFHPPRHFNPRSPHGERRAQFERADGHLTISIHAPRTGSDYASLIASTCCFVFQSTLPARGATRNWQSLCRDCHISIHAPRTGSDGADDSVRLRGGRISIHAPRTGSDDHAERITWRWTNFNPRSPHGERHVPVTFTVNTKNISIHAPRTGSDIKPCKKLELVRKFQSTLPARGATVYTNEGSV